MVQSIQAHGAFWYLTEGNGDSSIDVTSPLDVPVV